MHRTFFRPYGLRLFCLVLLLLTACEFPAATTPAPSSPVPASQPSLTPLPQSLVTFLVQIPVPLGSGESLALNVLDEVSGLALAPKSYPLKSQDSLHYVTVVPMPVHSVIKYRYVRQGAAQYQEHLSNGRAARYRLIAVDGPFTVQDVISRWTDTSFSGPTGRIMGRITDDRGVPIPNLMIAAGGAQTLTTSDGSYLIEGLPIGTHNLVVYSLDGAYSTIQQGAVVAASATTPASLTVRKSPVVKVTFRLAVPKGTFPAIPIRMAGNLLQLGNTFGDLSGGVSGSVLGMPVLSPLPDGHYTLTLELPSGTYVQYKYTLGDGLWNAEHTSNGALVLRTLIVPQSDITVNDTVETWRSGKSAPITFDATAPTSTPSGDFVSIQFNPTYGWTEPIPMWPVGNNRWIYVLYSPLETLGSIGYRYCRNNQCGSADDQETSGPSATGRIANTSLLPETLLNPIQTWNWLSASVPSPVTIPNVAIKPRSAGFLAGVEIQPTYHPSWKELFLPAFGDIHGLGANWIVLTPTWTFTRADLPVIEPLPGQDPLWPDLVETIAQARGQAMSVALFPTPHFPEGQAAWWKSSARDFGWWQAWFERYRLFLLHHADLASSQGASALIVGGDWLSPALPGGKLVDGSPSNVPPDAETRWRDILRDVRNRFKGTLLWAMPYSQIIQNPPTFLDVVDGIYLLWSAPLTRSSGASEGEMAASAGKLLDEEVHPFQLKIGKAVILALAYPSATNGSTGCLTAPQGGCLSLDMLARPNPDLPAIKVDLQDQVQAYSAMFLAVNERDWIGGLVSRGYYPPAALEDKSISIHGKPARAVPWYWFPRFLGVQK